MIKIKSLTNGRKSNIIGVSEVLGSILLMLISSVLFSVVYVSFFSVEVTPQSPFVSIVGSVEGDRLILNHQGGDALPLGTEIVISQPSGTTKRIKIENFIDEESKENNNWDMGEKIEIKLSDIQGYEPYEPVDLNVVDLVSSSVIMSGTVKETALSDLGISIDVIEGTDTPYINSDITLLFTIKNDGPCKAEEIKVEINVPEILNFVSFVGDGSFLDNIWYIDEIENGKFAEFKIKFSVKNPSNIFTQLGLILDSSDYIDDKEWASVINGIAHAIETNVIPNNGNVELTVVSYGERISPSEKYPSADVVVGPVVINNNPVDMMSFYINVASSVRSIQKRHGLAPMSCALHLTADTLVKSVNFNPRNKQIINLVVGGIPNYACQYYETSVDADRRYSPVETAEKERDYLINKLILHQTVDRIDCEAFINTFSDDYLIYWLSNKIAWPIFSVSSVQNSQIGWVKEILPTDDFSQILSSYFDKVLKGQIVTARIVSSLYEDPNPSNDHAEITIIPR